LEPPCTLFGVASSSRTRYAKCGDVEIAYQVLGDGPIDLLLYTGAIIPIDCMDEEPSMARFQRRLSSFGRLLRFDTRGMGLSDRGSPSAPPTEEQRAQDGVAVLDAVGSEHAVVLAPGTPAAGLTMAAMYPERVSRLVLVNGAARYWWAPDYPIGITQNEVDLMRRLGSESDAVEQGFDMLAVVAPSVATDPAFRAWWDRSGNLGMTPAQHRAIPPFGADVRSVLSKIRALTLIIQRADNPSFSVGHGHYLAEHIDRAKYVELPGSDLLYWVGDTGPMLDEIEEFVTGVRGRSGVGRILATMLFTDIVGSTDRAAQLGDERWRDLLDRHDQSVRIQIGRFRGREVKTVGDGFVATFDSPVQAIECALAIRDTLKALDIDVRAGIHTGEIEVRGEDVAGMAVHIAARVGTLAEPGQVLASRTVVDLVVGSVIGFVDRGDHELKGVPGVWKLFAVEG
jgi:class 3 adenylate cyclase